MGREKNVNPTEAKTHLDSVPYESELELKELLLAEREKVAALQARVERLRAVVAAARDCDVRIVHTNEVEQKLRESLEALQPGDLGEAGEEK